MDDIFYYLESHIDSNIFKSTYLIVSVAIFAILLNNVKLRDSSKISVINILLFVLLLLGILDTTSCILISTISQFLYFEFLMDDPRKFQLFNIFRRIIDFGFKAIVEYHYILFMAAFLSVEVVRTISVVYGDVHIVLNYLPILIIFFASYFNSKESFSTHTITHIAEILERKPVLGCEIKDMYAKYAMLTFLEDKTYFDRRWCSHTLLSPRIWTRGFKYLKRNIILNPKKTIRILFSRGYGTIEMQLIRTVGVKNGYEKCRIKRKIFEIVYATILFNSYVSNYRDNMYSKGEKVDYWILNNYISHVPILVDTIQIFPDDKTTIEKVYGKKVIRLSLEEFFAWCIHVEYIPLIGPNTLEVKSDVIESYGLSINKIELAEKKMRKFASRI